MKKVIWLGVVLMALGASNAQAQGTPPPPDNSGSWTVGAEIASGVDFGQPVGSIRTGSGEQSLGLDKKKDPLVGFHFGLKPDKGKGFEVRYMGFGSHGETNGLVAQTDGTLIIMGADAKPKLLSSAPILEGAVGYTIGSSTKISRVDFLGNYNFAVRRGWLSVFGGVPILKVAGSEDIARSQGFLLYARLPNGTLDTKGIREDYAYASATSTKATLVGLTGGAEGEYCIASKLILQGRVALAVFPWGSRDSVGQFTAVKDIYLVNVAGGLTSTPTQTIAHLNLPGSGFDAKDEQTVTAFDGQIGLKWRLKAGRTRVDIGGGIIGLSMHNVPGADSYMIHDGFAPGNGMFMPRLQSVSKVALMATIGVWF